MTTKLFSVAALLAAAVLALSTCSNPVNLVEKTTVEVMRANDRYLEVVNFGPANNATEVSPSATIWIEFDRTLDEETVTPATIEITPSVPWVFSFNDATKTLSIQPTMPGDAITEYTVVLGTGLKGTDGRPLFEERAWSFTTKLGPSGSVTINSSAKYTTSNTGNTITVTANEAAQQYRYALTKEALALAGWNNITVRPFDISGVTLSGTEGVNTVYFQFKDSGSEYTSIDNPIFDTIILDSVPPVVSSFTINSGAIGTTSTSVTLSQTMSDATSGVKYMQFMNTGGAWSSNQKPASTKEWTLASAVGTRQVSARITDFAGNTTTVSDLIIYGPPTVTAATLNSTTIGTVTVSFSSAPTADVGTDYCYVYRRNYPSGTTYTSCGYTTSSSLNVSVSEGSLYYFHVRVYNSNVGYSEYSTTSAIGYTSDIAIIYPTTDETIAADLKATLTNSSGWVAKYGVSGSMPSWSVTLIPESLVSSTYSAANVFYGDPVIIMPSSALYGTANKVRNVTAHGHGVVAMGSGGARLLDVVSSNFTSWGYSGTSPSEIGWLKSGVSASSIYAYTWFAGNSVWTSPMSCPPYIPATDVTSVQLAYSEGACGRVSVYRSARTDPTGGSLLCRDNIDYYFPVVRQGRFLQYGFYLPLNRFTGMTFTVNLVSLMRGLY
jgi:hypothetical protein